MGATTAPLPPSGGSGQAGWGKAGARGLESVCECLPPTLQSDQSLGGSSAWPKAPKPQQGRTKGRGSSKPFHAPHSRDLEARGRNAGRAPLWGASGSPSPWEASAVHPQKGYEPHQGRGQRGGLGAHQDPSTNERVTSRASGPGFIWILNVQQNSGVSPVSQPLPNSRMRLQCAVLFLPLLEVKIL